MNNLDKKKCLPCEGGLDPLSKDKCLSYLEKLNKDWSLNADVKSIQRIFTCKNHHEITSLVNLIIHISNNEDHHPEKDKMIASALGRPNLKAHEAVKELIVDLIRPVI